MLFVEKLTMYNYTCDLCKFTFMSYQKLTSGSCPKCYAIMYFKDKKKSKTSTEVTKS